MRYTWLYCLYINMCYTWLYCLHFCTVWEPQRSEALPEALWWQGTAAYPCSHCQYSIVCIYTALCCGPVYSQCWASWPCSRQICRELPSQITPISFYSVTNGYYQLLPPFRRVSWTFCVPLCRVWSSPSCVWLGSRWRRGPTLSLWKPWRCRTPSLLPCQE